MPVVSLAAAVASPESALRAAASASIASFTLHGTAFRAEADTPIGPGGNEACIEFRLRAPGGRLAMTLNGGNVATMELPTDPPARWQHGHPGLFIGRDQGLPVCDDYLPPFRFTGTLHEVVLESTDPAAATPSASCFGRFRWGA